MSAHLLFLVTADWYFCSHRLPLAEAAVEAGYRVTVVTQEGLHGERIRAVGAELVAVDFPRGERSPLREAALLLALRRHYRRLQPDICHHVAIKPVLYGAWAAHGARTPLTVNAIAGLGYLFTSSHRRARLLRGALKPAFAAALNRPSAWTIVQNADDEAVLRKLNLLNHERVQRIPGSGVDLTEYTVSEDRNAEPVVLLAARMLWDKGVAEFVEAARILQQRGVAARFVLVGDVDAQNPSCIAAQTLREWNAQGVVQWLGHRQDMPALYASASIVCLPSYREGFPKVLVEACAAARPCVTTDVAGCRDVVEHGVNGLLVPVRDAPALAEALQRLIDNPDLRRDMGARGRERAERDFDVRKIAAATLELYARAQHAHRAGR